MATPEVLVGIQSAPVHGKEAVLEYSRRVEAGLWGRQVHPDTIQFAGHTALGAVVPAGKSRTTFTTVTANFLRNYKDPDARLLDDVLLSSGDRALQEMGGYFEDGRRPSMLVGTDLPTLLFRNHVQDYLGLADDLPSRLVVPTRGLVEELAMYERGRALDRDDGRGRDVVRQEAIELVRLARPIKEENRALRLDKEAEVWTRRCEIQAKRPLFKFNYVFDVANLPTSYELAKLAEHELTEGVIVPWETARMLANGRRSTKTLEGSLSTIKSGAPDRLLVIMSGDAPTNLSEGSDVIQAVTEILSDKAA